MSADQAKLVRDARGMPEFVYNPRRGETSQEAFDLKGNPDHRPRLVADEIQDQPARNTITPSRIGR